MQHNSSSVSRSLALSLSLFVTGRNEIHTWNVLASIRLATHIEVIGFVFCKDLEELDDTDW
jgi:hypothetical protein